MALFAKEAGFYKFVCSSGQVLLKTKSVIVFESSPCCDFCNLALRTVKIVSHTAPGYASNA